MKQVAIAKNFWSEALRDGIPSPDSFYTSPLRRCLETTYRTFAGLPLPQDKPLKPIVKEMLRETIGRYTSARRSSYCEINKFLATFAQETFTFEPKFAEQDPLWDKERRESDEERQARLRIFLDGIFASDPGTWISLTSHSAASRAILAVIGHRPFRLECGIVMAVLVKAERLSINKEG